ncbi:alpha/beta hydrolase domain-containing protein 11-like protein [Leptotrombidium deliense]|uniref:sn-1-specific diacylglycerol lipase ABHD11 n=1 Tax=Leptotrombidium deliense TaxID=299467 RepID=A0A443S8M5_9ACAR|nr:alpha/beta hydrolase domain-containing protein 11-like protein [Leptotrombidium deliense]
MFHLVKRSFSTAAEKFATIGRNDIKSTVKLDYLTFNPDFVEAVKSPIVLYHGKFTTKHLWTPIADTLANATQRQVLSVDLRNHGGSEYTTIDGSHVPLMALDMKQFMDEQNIRKAILFGHSLGGRAMMQMAFYFPEMVEKLIVFDMGFNIPTKPLSFLYLFDQFLLHFIETVDANLTLEEAKMQIRNLLLKQIKDVFFVQVIADTLEKVNGKFQYSFNIEVMYESLWKGRVHHLDVTKPYEGHSLFIYGNTGFVIEEDFISIRTVFPNVKFEHIDTGHYGMVEKPDLFSQRVSEFINN